MMIVVGLGNPGAEYERTRHNVGRQALEFFARTHKLPAWEMDTRANAHVAKTEDTVVLLPETFMNRSGSAVLRYVRSKKAAERLVVVYDDLDLPLGNIKISFGRSSGGHNGVESIIKALGTKDFIRIRIGVSPVTANGIAKKPTGEQRVLDFLMSNFRPAEEKTLEPVFKQVGEALGVIAREGYVTAMNTYN